MFNCSSCCTVVSEASAPWRTTRRDSWDVNAAANRQVAGATGKDKQALIYVCLDMEGKAWYLLWETHDCVPTIQCFYA